MKPKQLFALAAVLIVVGIALLVIPTPGEPGLKCVSESSQSSGFVDEDQDNCPVSIESYDDYREWESGPKIDNIVGLVLVLAGFVAVGVAVVKRRRNPPPGPAV